MAGVALILCGLLGVGIVSLSIPWILRSKWATATQRGQDPHHTHDRHVPRFGGLALVVAFLVMEAFIRLFLPQHMNLVAERGAVLLGALAMFLLGFLDDLRPLGANKKLLGQLLIAGLVYYCGVGVETFMIPFSGKILQLNALSLPVTLLWLVGITNLINLIDGADGLAGGICLMLLLLLAYVGYQSSTFALLAAGMAGAVLGFLFFNFPPARIYLGDGGAYFLGFLIAMLSLVNSHKGTVFGALIAPLFVLALPILDTTLAICRRGLRGLPLFRPDRRHIHHHLLGSGMSRRKMVLVLYGVTLIFLLMGFASFWSGGRLAPLMLGLGVLVVLLGAGQLSFSREWLAVGRTVGNSLAMRQEIQYALCLSRWLSHEAERCQSLEELFQDLALASGRLGFTAVTLKLGDGKLSWSKPSASREWTIRQEVEGGKHGVLEFCASACVQQQDCPRNRSSRNMCPCLRDADLGEILAELMAEAWGKALRKLPDGHLALRFGSPAAGTVLESPTPALGGLTLRENRFSRRLDGNVNAVSE
jgi:UDP-GlcNAc:undecaprenyl-phosphate/decaprenyl-phosphate GlcNAc-1-phosphate transferase